MSAKIGSHYDLNRVNVQNRYCKSYLMLGTTVVKIGRFSPWNFKLFRFKSTESSRVDRLRPFPSRSVEKAISNYEMELLVTRVSLEKFPFTVASYPISAGLFQN
jgi:hypothetical protein